MVNSVKMMKYIILSNALHKSKQFVILVLLD